MYRVNVYWFSSLASWVRVQAKVEVVVVRWERPEARLESDRLQKRSGTSGGALCVQAITGSGLYSRSFVVVFLLISESISTLFAPAGRRRRSRWRHWGSTTQRRLNTTKRRLSAYRRRLTATRAKLESWNMMTEGGVQPAIFLFLRVRPLLLPC